MTNAKPAARQRGRPKTRGGQGSQGGDDLKALILNKACELTQTIPPEQFSVVMVARDLDVMPSLVRYYFKSRLHLLIAAAEQHSKRLREAVDIELAKSDDTFEGHLRARLRALIAYEIKYPHYFRLIATEIMPSDLPEAQALMTEIRASGALKLDNLIAEAGLSEFNRAHFRAIIMGSCDFYQTALEMYSEPGARAPNLDLESRRFEELFSQILLYGLLPR